MRQPESVKFNSLYFRQSVKFNNNTRVERYAYLHQAIILHIRTSIYCIVDQTSIHCRPNFDSASLNPDTMSIEDDAPSQFCNNHVVEHTSSVYGSIQDLAGRGRLGSGTAVQSQSCSEPWMVVDPALCSDVTPCRLPCTHPSHWSLS